MRLTVGPLPPAVYWRRRAVVLGALLLILILLMYACSGTESSSAAQGHILSPATESSGATPAVSAAATRAVPSVAGLPEAEAETPPRTPAPTVSPSDRCTDAQIRLTVLPIWLNGAASTVPVQLTLKIKNVSNRTCARDVGADAQELYVSNDSGTVWSSDFCEPIAHGVDVRTFAPGVEAAFYVTWDGTKAAALHACSGTVSPGVYQLVGRLNDKVSDPVSMRIEQIG